jgi:hypothetical protein
MAGADWRRRARVVEHGCAAVTDHSLDTIIEQIQSCIIRARALRLEMLERILSIALLEAYDAKGKLDRDGDED